MGSKIDNVLKDAASFMNLKKMFDKMCNEDEELPISEKLPIVVRPIKPGTWVSGGKVFI